MEYPKIYCIRYSWTCTPVEGQSPDKQIYYKYLVGIDADHKAFVEGLLGKTPETGGAVSKLVQEYVFEISSDRIFIQETLYDSADFGGDDNDKA